MWLNLLLYVIELKGHFKVKWMQTYAAIVFLYITKLTTPWAK